MSRNRTSSTSTFTHGASAYSNGLCRCEVCTDAARRRGTAYRARVAGSLKPGDPRHGTANGYRNYSCRCLVCTEAGTAKSRRYRARLKSRTDA